MFDEAELAASFDAGTLLEETLQGHSVQQEQSRLVLTAAAAGTNGASASTESEPAPT